MKVKGTYDNEFAYSEAMIKTPTADQVHSAVVEVAGLAKDKVHGTSNIQHLGLDSFMAFELLDLLKARSGLEIPHSEFESCQNLDDILRLIKPQTPPFLAQLGTQAKPIKSKCLVTIQRGSDKAEPIYLIHDGSGMCSMYSAISSLGWNVFGICCDPANRHQSINDMAVAYASLINTSEPFLIGGK